MPGFTQRAAKALVALSSSVWLPSVAYAASQGTDGDADELQKVVLLVIVIGAAYLLAHRVVGRLQRRFLVVSGVEYLLLGILLGPVFPAIRAFDNLTGLLPIIALAAGWVGLLRGTDFDLSALQKLNPITWRVMFLHHLLPGLAIGFGSFYLFRTGFGGFIAEASRNEAAISAWFLACCAAADSTEPVDLLARRYEIVGKLAPLLRDAARLGDIFVILGFGLLFCMFHENAPQAIDYSPSTWVLVTILLGASLGGLFSLFMAGGESDNARFLALVGIIAFASGGAYFLELSPLAVNLALGIVLVHSRNGQLLHGTLESTERPMMIVLLIFAGALWRPTEWEPTLIALSAFIVVRLIAKWIASMLAGLGTPLRKDLFRGLLAHGEVTLAMAVSFRRGYEGPRADIAYTVVLGSIVLHDLVAPRLLRGLLVDAGDLQRELKEPEAAGVLT